MNNIVPNSTTACAVVVTFNRLELLKQCLDGIRSQTWLPNKVIVVNNGSTDGTSEWLRSQSGLQVIDQENNGASAGFIAGMAEAERQGFDWIWCMDDDVRPIPEALERQMGFAGGENVVISHKFRSGRMIPLANHLCEKTGRKVNRPVPPGSFEEVNFGHFEGMLIPRSLIAKIGFPDRRTFIWGEDILYGFQASRVDKVILPKEPFFEKLVPESSGRVSNVTLYFDTRNHFVIFEALRRAGTFSPMAYVYVIARMVRHAIWVLQGKQNIPQRLRLLFFGLFDGLRGKWGMGSFQSLTATK